MTTNRRTFLKAATLGAAVSIAPSWLVAESPARAPAELSIALIDENGEEASYFPYKRVVLPRNAATWEIDGTDAWNRVEVSFPECVHSGQRVAGFGICIGGELMFVAELTASLHVGRGVRPLFAPGALPVSLFHAKAH